MSPSFNPCRFLPDAVCEIRPSPATSVGTAPVTSVALTAGHPPGHRRQRRHAAAAAAAVVDGGATVASEAPPLPCFPLPSPSAAASGAQNRSGPWGGDRSHRPRPATAPTSPLSTVPHSVRRRAPSRVQDWPEALRSLPFDLLNGETK